jgi:dipeptidyl aminopeptidase/acylaminoacyl peptidase
MFLGFLLAVKGTQKAPRSRQSTIRRKALLEMTESNLKPTQQLPTLLQCSLIFLLCATHGPVTAAADADPHVLQAVIEYKRPAKQHSGTKRPVEVADAIQMTKIGDPAYYWGSSSASRVSRFSPNGKHFVVVLRKGNLAKDSNEYTLLLWNKDTAIQPSTPQVLLTMSSTSNSEAIGEVQWLQDNENIAFLGEHPGETRQLYILNTRPRALRKLTNHPTSLLSYSLSRTSDRIAYVAERPFQSLWDDESRRHGVVVSRQWLSDLIIGRKGLDYQGADGDLFFLDAHGSRRLVVPGGIHALLSKPCLSPDGRYIVIPTEVAELPALWKSYQDDYLKGSVKAAAMAPVSSLLRYELVDTVTGSSHVLLDSPIEVPQTVWLPNSRSIVFADVFLPLERVSPDEESTREVHAFAVEVRVPDGRVTKISKGQITTTAWWENNANRLVFQTAETKVYFRKAGDHWEEDRDPIPADSLPEIVLDEGMNSPPKIYARDPGTGHRTLLLDLNPQFQDLQFARVEQIEWKASDGHNVKGGLYYPVDYVPGERYPLVIQTHGWNPNRFWIDGPWTTAFAAQPLASKGIAVLQADEGRIDFGAQKDEAEREVASFEGAIDYLDSRGLIDRNRVGLVGFSRTCFFVKYALTHSAYRFAAASVTEGEDGGYLQYITNNNFFVDSDSLYGGPPFGGCPLIRRK